MLPDQIGPYRIERILGQGGMGVVDAARDPAGRAVALKTLLDTSEEAARWPRCREARAAAAVSHAHVA